MNHLGELLSAHLDGELFDHERARVARHLETCDGCRNELNDLASARASVRSLPILEMPIELATAVGLAPHPVPLRRRPVAWAGAAAAAAMVVFVASAIVNAPEPHQISPPELSAVYGAVSSNEPGSAVIKVAVAASTEPAGGAR